MTIPVFDSFRVYDGDEYFADVSGPRETAWAEAKHYASQCERPRIEEVLVRPAVECPSDCRAPHCNCPEGRCAVAEGAVSPPADCGGLPTDAVAATNMAKALAAIRVASQYHGDEPYESLEDRLQRIFKIANGESLPEPPHARRVSAPCPECKAESLHGDGRCPIEARNCPLQPGGTS